MSRYGTLRNIAIVLAIAAIVAFLPGGSQGAATVEAVIWAAFGVAFGWVGVRLYREHRIGLYSLGANHRALLYGAVALGAFLLAGRSRMWLTGGGELLWFVLLAVVVYALLAVYRFWRSY
ncbi:MAG TPA: hypothetical protein VGF95_03830 [Solirubrobacteraceae bacterium]|jgi:hypothetical protein